MSEAADTTTPESPGGFERLAGEVSGGRGLKPLWDLFKLLAVVMLIKGCVIDQYSIPSESMEPTLHGDDRFFRGDRVLVNKWLYGPRIPFTTTRLWNWAAPERWDIVVFVPEAGASEHPRLVKRVVGLPGERVQIYGGRVEINGEVLPLPEHLSPDQYYFNDQDLRERAARAQTQEEVAYWAKVRELYPLRYGVRKDEAFSVVPEDHYFLLGDNSLHSVDSRVFGFVPRDHLLGRAFAVWWPPGRAQDFTGFSSTWWGMALLYGVPGLIVLYEIAIRLRTRNPTPAP